MKRPELIEAFTISRGDEPEDVTDEIVDLIWRRENRGTFVLVVYEWKDDE